MEVVKFYHADGPGHQVIEKGVFRCPKCLKIFRFRYNYGVKKKICKFCDESYGKKLSFKEAIKIRRAYEKGEGSLRKLGRQYKVSHNTIWLIVENKIWTT